MANLVLIPAYGTDKHIFRNLNLEGHNSIFVEYFRPEKNESIEVYCSRIVQKYNLDKLNDPIFIGVSLGGIMSVEISKIISVKKIILISTIKSTNERPTIFKILQFTSLYKIIHPKVFKKIFFFARIFLSKEGFQYFKDSFIQSDNYYLQWAVHQAVNWRHEKLDVDHVHLHGTKDRLFPIKKIKNPIVVKSGTHSMIYQLADKINHLVKNEIN